MMSIDTCIYRIYNNMVNKITNVKHIISIVSILILGIFLYRISQDKQGDDKTYFYVLTILLPFTIFFSYASSLINSTFNKFIIIRIVGLIISINFLFYLYTIFHLSNIFYTYLSNIFIFNIILVTLAIFYQIFSKYLIKLGGIPKFIILLIFYIPCLLTDLLHLFMEQLKITPNITYSLFGLEILLIIVYIIFKRYMNLPAKNTIELHKDDYFLDTKKSLQLNSIGMIGIKNYSISFWVFMNSPVNKNSFPLFCYGNQTNPKPMVTYGYDEEQGQYLYTIYFSNITNIKITLPNQKWNYFNFNYNGTNADLFINGILERSINLSHDMPIYDLSSDVSIGSNKESINAVISNIVFSKHPLTALQTLGNYRLGKNNII